MRKFYFKLPIFLEQGVRKKKKYYLNYNIMRNLKFHQLNSLKREMKRVVAGLVPEEAIGANLEEYTLHYKLFLPNKLKRDVSNVCAVVDKFACDAFVELGVTVEDNYNHLKHIVYEYGGYDDKKLGYVEVTIQEV